MEPPYQWNKSEHLTEHQSGAPVWLPPRCWTTSNILANVTNLFVTDRLRSKRQEVIVSLCQSTRAGGGGEVPQPDLTGGTPARGGPPRVALPARLGQGVPQPRAYPPGVPLSQVRTGIPLQQGYPRKRDTTWSTWQATVGMPLAFTQEDCLVVILACSSLRLSGFPISVFTHRSVPSVRKTVLP